MTKLINKLKLTNWRTNNHNYKDKIKINSKISPMKMKSDNNNNPLTVKMIINSSFNPAIQNH
jgi:hypothetical protein